MLKHITTLLMVLCLGAPALAAEKTADTAAAPAAQAGDKAAQAPETATPAGPTELSSKYYTVSVPEDWKAIMPPTENQGMTSAIFARTAGSAVVTMVVGPRGAADAKTIAGMFAEQFKAEKPPVERTASTPSRSPSRACPARRGSPPRGTSSWSRRSRATARKPRPSSGSMSRARSTQSCCRSSHLSSTKGRGGQCHRAPSC